jgi:hypothetical protein
VEEWTQVEQQEAELLQGKQYEVQLPQREQPMAELLQGRQYKMQLLQREQPMAVWTQGEQQEMKLLQRKQHKEQLMVPLNEEVPLEKEAPPWVGVFASLYI